eukprot:1161789-Pelagomonas_calceolata.AAC.5
MCVRAHKHTNKDHRQHLKPTDCKLESLVSERLTMHVFMAGGAINSPSNGNIGSINLQLCLKAC